ncbi:NFATC2-interacting protein isoform X2 [Emydura macquarii macquarii]|uniref:NFATC2-interacting protein isoform X2 n=1 Tax=Emydura macquarii macquarii TaxID=1129001 RepID=UPI00352A6654
MAERGAALRGLLESRGPREVEVGGVPGAGSEESEDRTQESCPPNAGSPIAVRVGRAPPPIYVGGSSSDSEGERVSPPLGVPGQPRPKRRRVLCSTEIPTVPVYSNKVNSSFKLCPAELRQEMPTLQWQGEADLDVDEISPVVPPRPERPHAPRLPQGPCPDWLEEESEPQGAVRTVRAESPSPPPPPRPTRRQRGRTHREVERQLRGLSSWLSAAQRSLREEPTEDDVILVEPVPAPAPRQLQLKVRCRAEIHRVPVETSQPLQAVVEHMAGRLQVRPAQILLLLRDVELPPHDTPQALGLGVADIIDCVVDVAAGEQQGGGEPGTRPGPGELRLTVRGQEKDSQLTLNVPRVRGIRWGALRWLMERYQEAMGLGGRQLRFFFDGQRLAGTRTPEQLGMEPDDVIEAWA